MTASTLRVAIALIAAAYGLVALSFVVGSIVEGSVGQSAGAGLRSLDLAVALSLVGAGALTLAWGGSRLVGLLAIVSGGAFSVAALLLGRDAPDWMRPMALVLRPFWPVLVLHLVVAASPGRRIGRLRSAMLVALYGSAAVLAIVGWTTYDPYFDPDCLACASVPAFIEAPAGALAILRVGVGLLGIATGATLLAWSMLDLRHGGSRPQDRWILAGGIVGGVAIIGSGAVTVADRWPGLAIGASVMDGFGLLLEWLLATAMASIGVGLAWQAVATMRTRVRLRTIADEMDDAPSPGSLESTLATILGDPTIRVGYWLADERRYVASDGSPFLVTDDGRDRRTTAIERGGAPVAVVAHGDGVDLDALREMSPSVLIALDNERLRAASLAHLRDLQASRRRIVGVGDAERRRVERDLHDGAQQGLLAISFDLRLARLNAERGGDTDRARLLEHAAAAGLEAVEELRRVAHGVHPAILSQAGLVPALASLADGSAIPVTVSTDLVERSPVATETAAYHVAVEALADAVRRGAHELGLLVRGDAATLTLDATDDGDPAEEPSIRIADRVGAAGGEVSMDHGPVGSVTRISVVLPCE